MDHDIAEDIMRGKPDHDLLRFLDKIPELDELKIELIDGKIVMQASAAPLHNLIVGDLAFQFRSNDWVALPEQALISERSGFEPKPDLTITTADEVADNRNPFPTDRTPLVIEVVSSDRTSDYLKKRLWYAISRIPQYLLIDPYDGICTLHSRPQGADYRVLEMHEFGEPIKLAEPFSFALDTTKFRLYPPKLLP
ncbi:Uma2 family endonuclease [Streptomyces sp. SCA3-4]|uniref:Uma2 family endonuclease n=1 Tax=Streptomyces sichuanensis TaxID=2871810 RepID=UPI001CE24A29|nr:Uma2 family endonuclease [Streptomyces sichuanensis]MCA6095006.1 Uma2 family endonuclease [Streptomyces sichuanensis]